MAEIVLINPRFEVSYWGLEHALPILGKRLSNRAYLTFSRALGTATR